MERETGLEPATSSLEKLLSCSEDALESNYRVVSSSIHGNLGGFFHCDFGGSTVNDIQLRKNETNSLMRLLELWLEAKEAAGCSPTTIDHYRREVSAFVKWLMLENLKIGPDDVTPSHSPAKQTNVANVFIIDSVPLALS